MITPIHADTTVYAVYTAVGGGGGGGGEIIIPPQPTSPGEIMSGGEGEPVEADVPAEDETVAPQGMHVTGTQTVTHEYLTLNGKVARETIRTNNTLTAVLDFIYDESGRPFALKYSTDGTSFQTYYYVLNLQGDVVKLIQTNGYVVAHYTYDAWGNILDSGGNLAEINPLRYRGYYYDNETGFYYLQSRYYDPANRRFINADVYSSTDSSDAVSCNMFAYCGNNPVINWDPEGDTFSLSIGFSFMWFGHGISIGVSFVSSEEKLGIQVSGTCLSGQDDAKQYGIDIGLSASMQVYKDIDDIDSLTGDTVMHGIGGQAGSFDVLFNDKGESIGFQGSVGLAGFSTPNFHRMTSYTKTVASCKSLSLTSRLKEIFYEN